MANDFLSTLRVYLSKLSEGDHNPTEMMASLNTWLRDSTESIKLKIEEEVERSVKKMGFVKVADFERLQRDVEELKVKSANRSPKPTAKPTGKIKATSKSGAQKSSKSSAPRTPAAPKKAVKKVSKAKMEK